MLFRQAVLSEIKKGKVTLAFRRWQKPTVKAGSLLHTAVGMLAIKSIDTVTEKSITEAEARKAGFPSRQELLADLRPDPKGTLYRIQIEYAGEDPRIALRNQSNLTAEDFAALKVRLARLDAASTKGSWTLVVLKTIAKNPGLVAAQLATKLRFEKEWLKTHIRKLKNLGLTESLETGYRVSPRGERFLEQMR